MIIQRPLLEFIGDGHWRVAQQPMIYQGAKERLTIPVGFATDGTSTPRFLWWLLPRDGDYFLAAVAHDYWYFSGALSRRDADLLFLRFMIDLNVKPWQWAACWAGVRIGGASIYNGYRKQVPLLPGGPYCPRCGITPDEDPRMPLAEPLRTIHIKHGCGYDGKVKFGSSAA